MPTTLRPIALFLLVAGIAACDGGDDEIDTTDTDTDVASDVVYADVQAILDANCTGCHGATPANGAPSSYVSYDQVSAKVDNIIARAIDADPGPMPPSGLALDADEEQVILDWKAAGTPEE